LRQEVLKIKKIKNMSIIHNIISKKPIEISKLNTLVSDIDGAMCENRGEGTCYFWIDGKSTRGFEITLEQDSIEVRNMILSNRYDYELTNKIIAKILSLTDGIIINEDEEERTNHPVFDNDKITQTEIKDCELVCTLSKEHHVSINGPIRNVHFGKRMYKEFESLEGEQLKNKMFDLILTVNYQIPNFERGNILQVGDSKDNQKIMKVLSNDTDYILDKYDYILLYVPDRPIMITNDILNTMLPSNWTLMDEYTVIAPVTDQSEWEKLLANAKKHDLWESFNNNK